VLGDVDHLLEDKYGGSYDLHPARAEHGETGNPAQDGLFQIGAAFSAGYGSEQGRGYVLELRMVTLAAVPDAVCDRIEGEAVVLIAERLHAAFPGRELDVERDGPVYKIIGDLSLGPL
jgi:hypothetical protein